MDLRNSLQMIDPAVHSVIDSLKQQALVAQRATQ